MEHCSQLTAHKKAAEILLRCFFYHDAFYRVTLNQSIDEGLSQSESKKL